jgi:hypothetical protein
MVKCCNERLRRSDQLAQVGILVLRRWPKSDIRRIISRIVTVYNIRSIRPFFEAIYVYAVYLPYVYVNV